MKINKDNILEQQIRVHDTAYIENKYKSVQKSDSKYALVQINIKNFRYYNTLYGYKLGDEILEIILDKLLSLLSDDEYGAHLYSDNYVLLLRYENHHDLIYTRIIRIIETLYRIDDERIYRKIFCSYGVFLMEDKNVSFHDALNFANLCRKETAGLKKRINNIETYDENFHQQYMGRIELEERTADAYKNYEFVSYLQPKVDLETEEIVSGEALLRWFDEDGNPVPLYDFLPILNENGYIEVVDLDMFDQLCAKMDQRIKENKKMIPISFNMSKTSFYSANILDNYIDTFEKYNIPKEMIEIEFMESISLDNTERMKDIVRGFKDYGFKCSLDDFGNGYSSFNVLLNAPFDVVKMDRQFFLNNLKGDNKLVIQTIVNLIHSLGMKVVAEGVETKEHIDYLKECGCDFVQGFYYYKPMSIQDFEILLDDDKTGGKYEKK